MKLEDILKIISIFLIIIIVTSFYLLFAGKINAMTFWVIVIVIAIAAYWGIPQAKKFT
ncbi:MAG: hypothetical protein ACE5DM_05660 [Candidatus Nanoarchaeia archaeon]